MVGLEKESLRVDRNGHISQTPHPIGLGAALKHPYITTDYSEALIELITPPFSNAEQTLAYLETLHQFVYQHIGDEVLWAASMPCSIASEGSIPIAEYGSSNIGRMKNIYRRGLSWRYGRAMQAIAGIHFNYSVNPALWPVLHELYRSELELTDFISEQYFGLIRNVQRHGWLVLYLFGSSPAFNRNFFVGREDLAERFDTLGPQTLTRPYATSLRMSDIGYRNDNQASLDISVDHLNEYVASLVKAIQTPVAAYEKIGIAVEGEYRQLSANILQIANEFYSQIRPKQITCSGESPTTALKNRGVRYIELRSLDLGLHHPLGVSIDQMRLLELFLLCSLLNPSPPLSEHEKAESRINALQVACCGRAPNAQLRQNGVATDLKEWLKHLVSDFDALASVLDAGSADAPYQRSVALIQQSLQDPEFTPSAQVVREMREQGLSFQEHSLNHSLNHAALIKSKPLQAQDLAKLELEAAESLKAQRETEANDSLSFEEFLGQYFARID